MGNYVNYEELILRYPALKDFAKQQPSAVESYLIVFAEAEIDGRLGAGFATPFSESLPVVKDLVFDLCWVKIMFTHQKKQADEMMHSVNSRIGALLDGSMILYDSSGDALNSTGAEIWSNVGDWHPTHSMLGHDSEYSHVSSERLEYEKDERD